MKLTNDTNKTVTLLEQQAAQEFDGDFLKAFVRSAVDTLGVRYGFVMENVDEPPTKARVLASWMGEGFGLSFEYALEHTPCEGVLQGKMCAYVQDVQQQFPQDGDLVDLQAQSYLGIPLRHTNGRILGHMAFMDTKPLVDADAQSALLGQFTGRLAQALVERGS